jgi:dihydroorotate dehydrogenase electron transfer subunit
VQGSRVHMATVVDRREAAGIVVLGLHAPQLATSVLPGQYVMAIPPLGGVAAVALALYEAEAQRVSLLFFITGKRTESLAALHVGDRLDVVGPLGNGFHIDTANDVAIVAGGVGIASVLLLAVALRRRGARVRLFYGAKTKERLVEVRRFVDAGCEIVIATEDGTAGVRGFITAALGEARMPEDIFACGPTPMLRVVAEYANRNGVAAQLCLEETFGCGIGGCWGCVVGVAASSSQAPSFPAMQSGVAYARICREGPVFFARELRW